jgi:hypothetical protein
MDYQAGPTLRAGACGGQRKRGPAPGGAGTEGRVLALPSRRGFLSEVLVDGQHPPGQGTVVTARKTKAATGSPTTPDGGYDGITSRR